MITEVITSNERHVWIRQSSGVATRTPREYMIPVGPVLRFRQGTGLDGAIETVEGIGPDAKIRVTGHTKPMRAVSLLINADVDAFLMCGWKPKTVARPSRALATIDPAPAPPPRNPLEGLHRDLDVAASVGLKNRHGIRPHIVALGESGVLCILEQDEDANLALDRPLVRRVVEVVAIGNRGAQRQAVSYYLTEEARRVILLRLGTPAAKEVRERVLERAAQVSTPAAAPMDLAALGAVVASSVTAALAPLLERLIPAQAAPQLPPGAVVVPPKPDGYELSQGDVARALGLPDSGEGSNLVGSLAREIKWNVEPLAKHVPIGLPGRLKDDAQLLYSATFIERFRPGALAAVQTMMRCGFHVAGGRLQRFDPKPTSTLDCVRQMREAALGELRKAAAS